MAQAAWAYQSAGLLLLAPDTFRSEAARDRVRAWVLDVLADTAAGRTARALLIGSTAVTQSTPDAAPGGEPQFVPAVVPGTTSRAKAGRHDRTRCGT
jgi:hypothetical protein